MNPHLPTLSSRAPKVRVVGGIAILGMMLVGGYHFVRRQEPPSGIPTGSSAISSGVARSALPRQPPALARSAPRPRPASDRDVLAGASREELLAVARDQLANGAGIEEVITLLEYLVATRPEFAIDLARDIGRSDGERHVLLYSVLSAWAQNDAPNALRWVFQNARLYDVPGNASLLYIVLEQTAARDPRAIVAASETAMHAGPTPSAGSSGSEVARLAIEALIKTGHGENAQQAVEQWARNQEPGIDSTAYEVVTLWLAQKSFSSAGAWLQALPSSAARNEAFGAVAAAWVQQDPAGAMEWAQGLNPADGGDDVRVATFGRWAKADAGAATQWLSAHPTSDNSRLLAVLKE